MGLSVTYRSDLTVVETLTENAAALSDPNVTHSEYNARLTAGGTSTPPVTKVASFEQALTVGAATIDLTALVGTNGAEVDGTGLRVQFLKLRAKSTNANPITISQGAVNGYDGFGTDFSLTLQPGAEVLLRTLDAGGDIGGANKDLDLAGTGSQVLECEFVLG